MVFEPDVVAGEGKSGVVCPDAKGLSEGSRSLSQVGLPSSFLHDFETMGWFESADENRVRSSFFVCHDIEKVVQAIAKIDVGNTPWSKHDFCSFGSSVVISMARFIFRPKIGFGFCDDATS